MYDVVNGGFKLSFFFAGQGTVVALRRFGEKRADDQRKGG